MRDGGQNQGRVWWHIRKLFHMKIIKCLQLVTQGGCGVSAFGGFQDLTGKTLSKLA